MQRGPFLDSIYEAINRGDLEFLFQIYRKNITSGESKEQIENILYENWNEFLDVTGFTKQNPTTFQELMQLYDQKRVQNYIQTHDLKEIYAFVQPLQGPYIVETVLEYLPYKEIIFKNDREMILLGKIFSHCLSQYKDPNQAAEVLSLCITRLEKQGSKQYAKEWEMHRSLEIIYDLLLKIALPDLENANKLLLAILIEAALLPVAYSYESWFLINFTNSKLIPLAKRYGYRNVMNLLLEVASLTNLVKLQQKYYRFASFVMLAIKQGAYTWVKEMDDLPTKQIVFLVKQFLENLNLEHFQTLIALPLGKKTKRQLAKYLPALIDNVQGKEKSDFSKLLNDLQ